MNTLDTPVDIQLPTTTVFSVRVTWQNADGLNDIPENATATVQLYSQPLGAQGKAVEPLRAVCVREHRLAAAQAAQLRVVILSQSVHGLAPLRFDATAYAHRVKTMPL